MRKTKNKNPVQAFAQPCLLSSHLLSSFSGCKPLVRAFALTGGDQPESSLLATSAGSEGAAAVFLCRNNSRVRVRRSLQTRRGSISDSAEKTKEKTGGETFSSPPLRAMNKRPFLARKVGTACVCVFLLSRGQLKRDGYPVTCILLRDGWSDVERRQLPRRSRSEDDGAPRLRLSGNHFGNYDNVN